MRKNFKTEAPWGDTIKTLWYFLDKYKGSYIFFSVILILTQFSQLLPTFFIGKIVDFFTTYHKGQSLTLFYAYVLILGIVSAIVAIIRLSSKQKLGEIQANVTYNTRVRGFEKLLDFSLTWHDSENTGNKVQRIENATTELRQMQNILNNEIFPVVTVFVGVLFVFFFIDWKFDLIALIYLVCFYFTQRSFYKKTVMLAQERNEAMETASGTYYEGLSNIVTLKTLGVKKDFKKNISYTESLTKDYSHKMIKLGTDKWKMFQLINAIFTTIFLFLVGLLFLQGHITLGSIIILYTYFNNLTGKAGDASSVINDLIDFNVAIARIRPIYFDKNTVREGNLSFPLHWSKIELSDLTLIYQVDEKDTDAGLNNINVTIHKSEKIGIVGRSGSGKSTFAKMLLGLYEITHGNYQIGQTNFYDLRHDEVTHNMSLVLQDSEMFNMSFQDNITLMREYDEKLFQRAIRIAQLEELIARLPEGVQTLIGEKGYRLSGGERQRIGIARAIYKDPEILILDEATSSLDTKTEEAIQHELESELSGKTIIIIAHRVSTLKNVDRILVFDQGQIVEEGTYNELLANSSSYFSSISQAQQHKKTV